MSDIDTAAADSLKALDPERPIGEATKQRDIERHRLRARRRQAAPFPKLAGLVLSAKCFDLLGHGVFVDGAILHNDKKVLAGVCNEPDILKRIAINQ